MTACCKRLFCQFTNNTYNRLNGLAIIIKRNYTTHEDKNLILPNLKRTPVHDFIVQQGGKMVPFAGWSMPVHFANTGVLAEHLHTRDSASLFDVSHMQQLKILGKDRVKFLEMLTVADIEEMHFGTATLSLLTNEKGGIVDDTIISKHADHIHIVTNAACAEKVLKHIRNQMYKLQSRGWFLNLEVIKDYALLAFQGPKTAEILRKLGDKDLRDFRFMTTRYVNIKKIELHMTRGGYTGEDGFEIGVSHLAATRFTKLLLGYPSVQLAGLGARDSLRLEAGLCLYGHDIDETTTPIEAGLSWTIGKRRRVEGGFLGDEHILKQLNDKSLVKKRRIGLTVEGAPARENAEIYNEEDQLVGKVTSGGPSPTLGKNIAMGYVRTGYNTAGTPLKVKVRERMQKATVVKMPFVKPKYYRGDETV
ncbi:1780_t:CDS:2 [Diversispora eburnea]|uniref:Aminomethyltransferase n=3 Tax=Diversisporales TaxID=214509 RepID=A0A9N8YI67_9GLOM|nr:1780_t:CDS:2 [Diversispora eburnea]